MKNTPKTPPTLFTITGAGDSIWESSSGTCNVTHFNTVHQAERVRLIPQNHRGPELLAKGFTHRQYLTIDVTGPHPLPFWYTDTAVPKLIQSAFGDRIKRQFNATEIEIDWSEQGMQRTGVWNFDVLLLS